MKLTLLTYNVWGLKVGPWRIAHNIDERIRNMVSHIQELDADVIALQEVWCDTIADFFQSQLNYRYGYYEPSRKFIKGRLGNGLMFLSRYPMVEKKFIEYSAYTRWFEFFANKGALMVLIETPNGSVNVFNTHLGSGNHINDIGSRTIQARELQRFIERFPNRRPALLLGDFNFNPFSTEYQSFSHWMLGRYDEGPSDTFRQRHPNEKGFTFHVERSSDPRPSIHNRDERIDYIFSLTSKSSRSALELAESRVVLNFPNPRLSDHCGVLSSFVLTPKVTWDEAVSSVSYYDQDFDYYYSWVR